MKCCAKVVALWSNCHVLSLAKWKSVILAHLKIAPTMLSAILFSSCQGSKGKALRHVGPHAIVLAHARFLPHTQPHPAACLANRGRNQRRSDGNAVRWVLRAVSRGGRADRARISVHRRAPSAEAGIFADVELWAKRRSQRFRP